MKVVLRALFVDEVASTVAPVEKLDEVLPRPLGTFMVRDGEIVAVQKSDLGDGDVIYVYLPLQGC